MELERYHLYKAPRQHMSEMGLESNMAYINPTKSFEELKTRTVDAIKGHFPVEGSKRKLVAKKVYVDDNKSSDDIKSQAKTKINGRTWSVPVKADLQLIDKKTGKVKEERTVTVAQLPKITRRYTYIVDGNEYQIPTQLRLKSGVYTRVKDNGELEGQWNLAKGQGFKMDFKPESRKMTLAYQGSNVALYPVLKTMGVSDDELERAWGKEILAANKAVNSEKELAKLHRKIKGVSPANLKESQAAIIEEFGKTELRPDSTALTLGKPFKTVDGKSLLFGSSRLLKVARGEEAQDERDALPFKDALSVEDFVESRIKTGQRRTIEGTLKRGVEKHSKIGSIIHPDVFGKHIKTFFSDSNTTAELPPTTNPTGFLVGNRKTTVFGSGGITSEHSLTPEAQNVNPSHFGFLDIIQTPESGRTGVVLQMGLGTKKVGRELYAKMIDPKTGKEQDVNSLQSYKANIAFPDQYKTVGGKPQPLHKRVKVYSADGTIEAVAPDKVDYIIKTPQNMFDFSANLVPFLGSNQGGRASMAAKQIEQAVSLKHREKPLVQVQGSGKGTFEELVGRFSSHSAPVNGEVVRVGKEEIIIKDAKGKKHEIPLYKDFPLSGEKAFMTSEALVKAGDKVKVGQTIADTNFTSDGVLSLGTGLRTAYQSWRGYNFEDGIVISEAAAKKLTSTHMAKENVSSDKKTILDKKKFRAYASGQFNTKQLDKLDDSAVIKEGETVQPGDVLIGVLKEETITPEQRMMGRISKKFLDPVRPRPVVWKGDHEAQVVRVARHGRETTVHLKTDAPAEVGDKIVGRHANKGVITLIVPDKEMPADKDGKPIDVLLNPGGIPTRQNVGQVLETAASKIAEKTGKPYLVKNFDAGTPNYLAKVRKELKEHGLKDTEDLKDPQTGRVFKDVFTGNQYFYKLHHTAEKGMSARSIDKYDTNMTPKSGGDHAGQKMDIMGIYALLAHGAKHNIREMASYKTQMDEDFWHALQVGDPIPAPKVPFVFDKFLGYLKGMGVDTKKDGNSLILSPLTDKQILDMSSGELKDPGAEFDAKDLKPKKGGLFDPKVTGTTWPHGKMGANWSHFRLKDRMPNPTFEKPIRELLGMTAGDFGNVISGGEFNGKKGSEAIVEGLKAINVDKELAQEEQNVKTFRGGKLDKAAKRLKYLRALKRAGLNAKDAYTLQNVPVLPPNMRPVSVLDNGELTRADINGLYAGVGKVNDQLKSFPKGMPESERHILRKSLYDGLKALALGESKESGRTMSGLASQIAGPEGKTAKEGFFQEKVVGKRQDLSGRGLIVPDPTLNLDEAGIPRKMAREMYKPFVVADLVRSHYTPAQALDEVKKNTTVAERALEKIVNTRPVMLKRDPVLHKYGIQAFRPRLIEGKSIKIHPLVTGGYNADFDGDKMGAFVPITTKAVEEARKMFPSHNLFSPSTGLLMYTPKQEATLGLYKVTEVGKKTNKTFKDTKAAVKAHSKGEIDINDIIEIIDPKEDPMLKLASMSTTLGRLMLYHSVPETARSEELLRKQSYGMDKKKVHSILSEVGFKKPEDFSDTADKMKDIGNYYATGLSFGLKDFNPETEYRDGALAVAERSADRIRKSNMSAKKKKMELAKLYTAASMDISKQTKKKFDRSNNRMYDWIVSGARGNWDQFRQMTVAPLLAVDAKGEPVPVPIDKSYAEGLDTASYMAAAFGARRGMIGRAKETERPGALTKELMNTSMDQMVQSEDCGTTKGITLDVDDRDIVGRFTAKDINIGARSGRDKGIIPAGTLLDTSIISRLKNNKVKEVPVRSPLKCDHGAGVCAKCYGLDSVGKIPSRGTNLGVIAAHSMGEPMAQLSMNSFHSGGVVGAKGSTVDAFTRLDQLFKFPDKLPGSATLATAEGSVEKIEDDPAGGKNVYVRGVRHFVPSGRDLLIKRGVKVKKGDSLSEGPKHPKELLPLAGLDAVQRYITDEVKKVYTGVSGVKRRNVETFVRSLTNLSKVTDPGNHPEYIKGDLVPTSKIKEYNRGANEDTKPVKHAPILKGVNVLPREMREDWLAMMQANNLKNTLLDASAEGWRSLLHSTHPIPGLAYAKEFGEGTKEEPWLY